MAKRCLIILERKFHLGNPGLIALHRDNTNCLVLGNIGLLLASIGKKKEAGIYFRKVVSLNKDPDETREAQNYLSGKKLP